MRAPLDQPASVGPCHQEDERDQVVRAARDAARRIAPLWPLHGFVAVNPFVGLAARPFADAAVTMARAAGARLTLPRDVLLAEFDAGRVTAADLDAALAGMRAHAALPADAATLLAIARRPSARPAPLATVADIAGELSGVDWPAFVVDRISAWAAAHFDRGQAAWPAGGRSRTPYRAWRDWARVDRSVDVAGAGDARRVFATLPDSVPALLVEAVRRLGVTPALLPLYFHRLLASIGGWAGHARHLAWQGELHGREDDTVLELLAVRLAWEVALHRSFAARPGFDERWREPVGSDTDDIVVDCVLQAACEDAHRRRLLAPFATPRPLPAPAARPAVQAAFCIDVRSEVFRRALEGVAPGTRTVGFAGFFGLPIEYLPLGRERGDARCPVLLAPRFAVRETVRDSREETDRLARLRRLRERVASAWRVFGSAAVSSFSFVETLGLAYLGKLVGDALGVSRPAPAAATAMLPRGVERRLGPSIESGVHRGRAVGLDAAARIETAATLLAGMSMTSGFARLVLLVGHGATTVNNPYASGLDCGACGGHGGGANARVAAAVLNDGAVRRGLAERGIGIPDDTVFVAALHDTTTDEVHLYDADAVPASHADELATLRTGLARAGALARAERAVRLGADADALAARSRDWSEVRPEWGLAGCALFVAAPRERSAGLDLGGRAFLHSYDRDADPDGRTLELIMTAPLVVATWINLQYFGSTVDNRVFGSGNKVLHNVVGTLGVLEGNGGDLRVGLPWQSLHDGEHRAHEPLRLAAVFDAPREAMNAVIARHPPLRDLLDNGWLALYAMDERGVVAWRYAGALAWQEVDLDAAG